MVDSLYTRFSLPLYFFGPSIIFCYAKFFSAYFSIACYANFCYAKSMQKEAAKALVGTVNRNTVLSIMLRKVGRIWECRVDCSRHDTHGIATDIDHKEQVLQSALKNLSCDCWEEQNA